METSRVEVVARNSPLELELVPCAIEVEYPALGLGDLSSTSLANILTFSTKAEEYLLRPRNCSLLVFF